MAPSRITIDWQRVDHLMMAGCSGIEIAASIGVCKDTFYRRVEEEKGTTYQDYLAKLRAKGDSLLREVQYNKALEKDNMMMIWLGKNRLKQSDSPQELALAEKTLENYTAVMTQLSSLQSNLKIEDKRNSNETKS